MLKLLMAKLNGDFTEMHIDVMAICEVHFLRDIKDYVHKTIECSSLLCGKLFPQAF